MEEHNIVLKLGVAVTAPSFNDAVKRAREIEKAFACLIALSPGVRVIDKTVLETKEG